MLYPFFKPWLQLEESPYGILYYSSGFLGYFILGFYLRRFGIYLRFLTSIFLLCIVILIPVVYKLFIEQYGLDFGDIFWYLSFDCPILVILWWNILKYLADWLERFSCIKHFCVMFSNLSFGMYLCHILIQRYWLWHVSYILNIQNYILQTFTMNIYDELENLKVRARSNPELAQALLATRGMKNPVSAFCRIAQEHGCTFSAMDLVSAGEDSYAAMRRSTNGGGENSPLLQGEDDLYEMFLIELM